MQLPLQISLHGIQHSDAIHDAIRQRAEKLERFHPRIVSCRVVLEQVGRHHRQGRQLVVRIDLKVPGGEIAITRKHDEDLMIALREAFHDARRRLEEFARGQRGDVKTHPLELTGRIARLDPDARFGFIGTEDGREFYFSSENVVTPPFEHLSVGASVRFIEDAGSEGAQARRVTVRNGRQGHHSA